MSAIDTRNTKRDSLFLMAEVRTAGSDHGDSVRVRNLSDSGIMVQGPLVLKTGDRVVVSLKKIGEVGGSVAWIQSARIGIAFDEPINSSLARTNLVGEKVEAPRYARPAVAPRNEEWRVRKL